jgi:peptidoglycan/xylan/chitin deacetylase (PgdA/CDA1 family)/glycosyltransferase involved in cell wall biosynthesis
MAGATELRCSVVIPTHARATSLQQVLHALRVQTLREFEVIVVVDGEDGPTRSLSERVTTEYPLRWIFLPACSGQANARNVGAHAALATYIAFLDDDTLPAAQWLERHMLGHAADGDWMRIVRGKTWHSFARPNSVVETFLRSEQQQIESSFGARAGADITIRECCVGVNCSVKRSAFLECGGFDGNLREIDEDMELGTRMFLRGARFVYEPSAIVEHRDLKLLCDYYLRCWRAAASTGVYRFRTKGERTEQLRPLTRLWNGRAVQRIKERFAWERPERAKRVAESMRHLAEASGSRTAARLWRSFVSSAEYWDEVQKCGFDAESLMQGVGSPIPTLAFHSIARVESGDNPAYCITPAKFQRMMQWLGTHGYQCVQPGASPTARENFELTFDDAYENLYTELLPYIERWQLRPLVFVVTGHIGGHNAWDAGRARPQRLLNAQQMCDMQSAGVQFGAHTISHPDLTELSDGELRREVRESKSRLEDLLGTEVSSFAYPYGIVDERGHAAVGEAGYKRAYTTQPGLSWFGDPLLLRRVELGEADSMASFRYKVKHGASPVHLFAQHMPERAKRVLRMLL